MRSKNPLQNWSVSQSAVLTALQIFCYNGISVVVIAGASLFGKEGSGEKNYLSVGYLVMLVLVCLNGVVLGTWSFSESTQAIPLVGRLVGMFDIAHRAAL